MVRCGLLKKRSFGAVMVESALALALLILLGLGLADVIRYVFALNMLQTAAQNALTFSSYVPDLEAPDNPNDNNDKFDRAKKLVTDKAINEAKVLVARSGMVTLGDNLPDQVLTLPYLSSDTTLANRQRALSQRPIEIELRASMRFSSIPGLTNIPILGRAVGFREVVPSSSGTAMVDCLGRPLLPGQSFSPSACNCPGGSAVDPGTGQCENICQPPFVFHQGSCACRINCENSVVNQFLCACEPCQPPLVFSQGQCVCPNSMVMTPSGCQCPPEPQCPPGQVHIGPSCECGCPPGQVMNPQDGSCGCPEGLVLNGSTCSCPTSCSGGMVHSGNTCDCSCPPGQSWDEGMGRCVCPGNTELIDGQCLCPINSCPSGMTPIGDSCSCECLPPHQNLNGQCRCPNSCGGGDQDPLTCQCNCGNTGCPVEGSLGGIGGVYACDCGGDE